jgi:hypothetical protein
MKRYTIQSLEFRVDGAEWQDRRKVWTEKQARDAWYSFSFFTSSGLYLYRIYDNWRNETVEL